MDATEQYLNDVVLTCAGCQASLRLAPIGSTAVPEMLTFVAAHLHDGGKIVASLPVCPVRPAGCSAGYGW